MSLESDLDKLLFKLSNPSSSRLISHVKYPDLLFQALTELKNLIGMKRVKDSIALQVIKLLKNIGSSSPKSNMLHTVLYGPPGVGKTRVGIVLAKIWYALGYLKEPDVSTEKPKEDPTQTVINTLNEYSRSRNTVIETLLPLAIIFGIPLCLQLFEWGGYKAIILIIVLALILWLLYKLSIGTYNMFKGEAVAVTDGGEKRDIVRTVKKENKRKTTEKNIKIQTEFKPDRELITVVSRKDFIAEYMGQTAIKTQKLLEANRGKVVFIDEAYSLLNDPRDAYGHEALSTLILFMSEHPDEIGIIFAGYKEKLEATIFEAQPGLVRRCMWHFDCDPYTGKELAQIFMYQLQQQKHSMSEPDMRRARLLIQNNIDDFPSFGGDTERLLYFAQLEACRNNLSLSDVEFDDETLTYEDIERALQRLRDNNIKTHVSAPKTYTCDKGSITEEEITKILSKFSAPPQMAMDSNKKAQEEKVDDSASIIQERVKEIIRQQIVAQH